MLKLFVASLTLNVVLNLFLDRRFGAIGAGVALVCTELFGMIVCQLVAAPCVRLPHTGVVLAAGTGAHGGSCRGAAAAIGPPRAVDRDGCRCRLSGNKFGGRSGQVVDTDRDAREEGDGVTLEADRPYLKRPVRGVPPPRTGRPRLAVLVIAFKSHQLLEMCLASVVEHLPDSPVYVYENSGDGYPGREELAARHPEVHWVMGPENIGFAGAVNALVEHTPPDADLLLLNPDARLQGPLTRTRHCSTNREWRPSRRGSVTTRSDQCRGTLRPAA